MDLPEPLTPVTQTSRFSGIAAVDVAQVVLARTADHESRIVLGDAAQRAAAVDLELAAQVLRRQRFAVARERSGRAVEHDAAAGAARPRPHVDDAVRREHDLRVVLDDEQRIAGIAQLREHVDDAAEVARMQPDARLIEHEQRIDERRAERRRQIDALHFAARQRARLPIEREVAEAHVAQVPQPVPDLAEHQLGRVVERLRQFDALEECERALDGQHHEVVDREARQRGERLVAERRQMPPFGGYQGARAEAPLGVDDGGRIGERAEPP